MNWTEFKNSTPEGGEIIQVLHYAGIVLVAKYLGGGKAKFFYGDSVKEGELDNYCGWAPLMQSPLVFADDIRGEASNPTEIAHN